MAAWPRYPKARAASPPSSSRQISSVRRAKVPSCAARRRCIWGARRKCGMPPLRWKRAERASRSSAAHRWCCGPGLSPSSVSGHVRRARVARLLALDLDPELARLLVVPDRLLEVAWQGLARVFVVELAEAYVGERMAELGGVD